MKLGKTKYSLALWPVLYIGNMSHERGLYMQWLHWRLDLCRWRV